LDMYGENLPFNGRSASCGYSSRRSSLRKFKIDLRFSKSSNLFANSTRGCSFSSCCLVLMFSSDIDLSRKLCHPGAHALACMKQENRKNQTHCILCLDLW
jgi:hypothetical protein